MKTFFEFLSEVAGTLPGGEIVKSDDWHRLLAQYENKPWVFGSFRGMSGKLGINPKYNWGFTPNAIYGYQIKELLQPESELFGGDSPFVIIFTVKEAARPYIINITKADQDASRHAEFIIDKYNLTEANRPQPLRKSSWVVPVPDKMLLDALPDELVAELGDIFDHFLPTLPGFFRKFVQAAKGMNIRLPREKHHVYFDSQNW